MESGEGLSGSGEGRPGGMRGARLRPLTGKFEMRNRQLCFSRAFVFSSLKRGNDARSPKLMTGRCRRR